jgi:hypothetical protein
LATKKKPANAGEVDETLLVRLLDVLLHGLGFQPCQQSLLSATGDEEEDRWCGSWRKHPRLSTDVEPHVFLHPVIFILDQELVGGHDVGATGGGGL